VGDYIAVFLVTVNVTGFVVCVADEPDPKSIISYNVELPRFAGPLGISLTSKADVPGSVIIAGLTPDGLADKLVLYVNN